MAERISSPVRQPVHSPPRSKRRDSQISTERDHLSTPPREGSLAEAKKCWICFGDSTEDTPGLSSSWRTPCPCALTAHEACLLDWIADLEAPANSASQSRHRKDKIECPQCKTEIRVARPWSPVVASVRAVERVGGALVVPGLATLVLGGIFSACFVHGAMSVFLVIGPEDYGKMVGTTRGQAARVGLRLILGLPLVPVTLILSRTKLADGLLPILPILFFAPRISARRWHNVIEAAGTGSTAGSNTLNMNYDSSQLWPPSIEAVFVALPYIRAIYNAGYAAIFAQKEGEWNRAIQREPRTEEAEDQVDQAPGPQERGIAVQAEIIFENGDGDDDNDERDPAEVQAAIDDALEQVQEQRHQAEAGHNGDVVNQQHQIGQEQQQGGHQINRNQENGLIVSASRIADAVLGALCFPAIASIMGEVLRVGFPSKLTSISQARKPGLLHTKWGRSVVGGCLFVVMKDALVLYSRYRLAQDHKKRRVLDYKGTRTRSNEAK